MIKHEHLFSKRGLHSEIIADQTLFFDGVLTQQNVIDLRNNGNGVQYD